MSAATVVEQSVAAFVLHALWQVPLLAGAAWCAVRTGRPRARVAHGLWLATLVMCVVLPVCSTVGARRAALAAERNAQVSFSYEPAGFDGDLQPLQRQPAWKRVLHRHLNSRDGLQPFAFAIPQGWARILSGAWALLIVFFAVQLALGWMRVRALIRSATDDPLPDAIGLALQQQCEALRMAAPLAKLHNGIAGPVLAGVLQPTLLLPAQSARELSSAEVAAVLAHELAHVRRHDPMVHAACSLLLLPVCFHPVALWAARCVRQTREMACDAEAAERMGSPAEYAWALLQVADRTHISRSHAVEAGLFTNGLFGAGLQLFTNRGAMEERMQMLMNGNGSKVRGRAVRAAAGISLAAVAVIATTMLQVQPTLAAERSLPQAAATVQNAAPAQSSTGVAQESDPPLIGGEHAREQLRRAHRQLLQAESQSTNPEDRRKIEGAQQAIAVAEQALSAADASSRTHVHADLPDLGQLNVQLKGLKLPDAAEFQARMAGQQAAMNKLQEQMNSPEWKAQMQQLQISAREAAQAQMNSPEVKAQIEAARKLDRAKIDAMMAKAHADQQRALEQLQSGAIQRQMAEAARLMAQNEMPAIGARPSDPSTADWQDTDKPLKIGSGVMAGNKIGGANPIYPAEAKQKHIMGTVVLHAIIDKAGHVESIQVVSSPDSALSNSAMAAVETWTYRPYLLNGNPMAVDTTINVNYSLVQ